MAKRIYRSIFFIVGAVLICLSILYGVLNQIANERLPALLGENVEIDHVDIQIFGLTANFSDALLTLEGTKESPDLRIEAFASNISIQGFSIMELLFSKTIGVRKFQIDSLLLSIELPDTVAFKSERKDINLFVTDIFTRIKVDQFELNESALLVFKQGYESKIVEVLGFDLQAEKISLDTASIEEFFPLRFEKSRVYIDRFAVNAGQDYRFQGGNVRMVDSTLSVVDVKLIPNDSREVFAQKHPYEKARLDIEVDSIYFGDLMWDKQKRSPLLLHANHADLHGLNLLVFKDKRAPQQPIVVKPLLTGLLKSLPLSVSMDTLRLIDSYIEYEQFPVRHPRVGKVFFDDLYTTGYNITNDSTCIAHNPSTMLDIQSRFMGKGDLQVQIKLDMTSSKQAYSVSGNLAEMPMTYLNQVLAPLAGIKAEGQVQKLTFQFDGDEYDSHGQMDFQYSDLKVEVMGDDKEKSWFKSLLGNLILSTKNLESDSSYKQGEIYFVRYQNKDFFNMLWNSVRVGLMDIVVPFYSNEDKNHSPEDGPKYKIEEE